MQFTNALDIRSKPTSCTPFSALCSPPSKISLMRTPIQPPAIPCMLLCLARFLDRSVSTCFIRVRLPWLIVTLYWRWKVKRTNRLLATAETGQLASTLAAPMWHVRPEEHRHVLPNRLYLMTSGACTLYLVDELNPLKRKPGVDSKSFHLVFSWFLGVFLVGLSRKLEFHVTTSAILLVSPVLQASIVNRSIS